MIKIKNLTKKYGSIYAIKDLTFEVKKGEIIGFLGPNGAGKSTTMNIITGCIPATSGEADIAGYSIMDDPMEVKKRIGYLPEMPPLYLDMRVIEYLKLVAELKRVPKKERKQQIEDVMDKLKIADVQTRKIKNLSKGYKQRVGFAQALLGHPDVLILDEPTVGLDPQQIMDIRELIKNLAGEHTVILSSHILSEVSAVCSKVIIINKGEIVAVDTPENLQTMLDDKKKLNVVVEATRQKSINIINGIEGVENIEVVEEAENTTTYIIECMPEVDVEKNIFFALANEGIPIKEIKNIETSLEDVFLEIINSDRKFKVTVDDEEEIQEDSEISDIEDETNDMLDDIEQDGEINIPEDDTQQDDEINEEEEIEENDEMEGDKDV